MTWRQLLGQWELLARDLHDADVDVADDGLMRARSWRWLEQRILGLLDRPVAGYAPNGRAVFPTRIQEHLYGPAADAAVARAMANAKR